jgi:hypothetical protein
MSHSNCPEYEAVLFVEKYLRVTASAICIGDQVLNRAAVVSVEIVSNSRHVPMPWVIVALALAAGLAVAVLWQWSPPASIAALAAGVALLVAGSRLTRPTQPTWTLMLHTVDGPVRALLTGDRAVAQAAANAIAARRP